MRISKASVKAGSTLLAVPSQVVYVLGNLIKSRKRFSGKSLKKQTKFTLSLN